MLVVRSREPITARSRSAWRSIGFYLDCKLRFERQGNTSLSLSCSEKTLTFLRRSEDKSVKASMLSFGSKKYPIISSKDQIVERNSLGNFFVQEDFISPLVDRVTLKTEDGYEKRGFDGTIVGLDYISLRNQLRIDEHDYVFSLIKFLAQFFEFGCRVRHRRSSKASIIMTFDVDGVFDGPNSVRSLKRLSDKYGITFPTLMMMAQTPKQSTFYDPIIDLNQAWLAEIWRDDLEIGLHSSFAAYNDYKMFVDQKRRLEAYSARNIKSHRSHYLRSKFPRSFGIWSRAGILLDSSVGFADLSGYRNFTGLPIKYADPAGESPSIWEFSLNLMDQHLFIESDYNSAKWVDSNNCPDLPRQKALLSWIERVCDEGGVLTLDWHLHTLEHDAFPYHQISLESILAVAKQGGAWIGGMDAFIGRHELDWLNVTGFDDRFDIRNAGSVVVSGEEFHYSSAMNGSITKVAEYVDATASSLDLIIPPDVEKIVDVGCGHGWVSQRIGPFFKVLCIDTTEEILANVSRRKILGDITDIPVSDASVDMLVSTDVLEHLSDEKLDLAVREICRVTSKWVYLQVPHDEVLELSTLSCKHCSYSWHLNFHKRKFCVSSLAKVMENGWKVKSVVFTGEHILEDTKRPIDVMRRASGVTPVGLVGDFKCPSCAETSKFSAIEMYPSLNGNEQKKISDLSRPLLHYSEVGILFGREVEDFDYNDEIKGLCLAGKSGRRAPCPDPEVMNTSVIIAGKSPEFIYLNYTIRFPYLVFRNCCPSEVEAGLCLTGPCETTSAVFFVGFPKPEGARNFEISLYVNRVGVLEISGFDCNSTAQFSFCKTLEPGPSVIKAPIDSSVPIFSFQISVPSGTIFRSAEIDAPALSFYKYDIGRSWYLGHVVYTGTTGSCLFAVPSSGVIFSEVSLSQIGEQVLSDVQIERTSIKPSLNLTPTRTLWNWLLPRLR